MPNLSKRNHLQVIPLGGLGEFGMNMMVYRWGNESVIVDAGMMFPGSEHLGVDVVIPDFSFLKDCGTLHGVVLTHGHEDHIGALPYLLSRHDIPTYASPYTLGLLHARMSEHPGVGTGNLHRLPRCRARRSPTSSSRSTWRWDSETCCRYRPRTAGACSVP